MSHPYEAYRTGQGNGWLKGLRKYIEEPKNEEVTQKDSRATLRDHGGEKSCTTDADYARKGT